MKTNLERVLGAAMAATALSLASLSAGAAETKSSVGLVLNADSQAVTTRSAGEPVVGGGVAAMSRPEQFPGEAAPKVPEASTYAAAAVMGLFAGLGVWRTSRKRAS